MNSSGKDSNPLKRGIWLLESLLNDPPPPPPPAVPIIDLTDPEIAKMTLKERIEDHRNQPACISCHVKIDPWGIALENYDALGLWREQVNGKPVDSTSRLFNNESLNGMDGLKRFLLKNRQDQFVRALTHKMMVYALGRPLTFADRNGVEAIAAKVRQNGDGLATLVLQITSSELFLSK
jgi:MFS superfamily sulfate permease-like transporter